MKVLSLFSGVGGFDLGLERAGMETVFQCEWDKHATNILERHWPNTPRWTDVSTLTGAYVLQHAPIIDVVAWGSPCQDLSVAGKRAGLGGERSGLFHEGIRIIKEIREITNGQYPRFSIWENVAGALSSSNGADFGEVLYEMDEAGACFSEWRLLDAQYFGVPQRRRRVFVVSVFDSATAARCPNPLLPICEGVRGDIEAGGTEREEPTGTVAEGFGSGSFGGWTSTDTAITLSARDNKSSNTVVVGSLAARDYKGVGNQYVAENKCVVETFTKAKRAQTSTDDERTYRDVTGALLGRDSFGPNHEGARDGKLILEPIGFSHTQGLSAQPSETAWPTLRQGGAEHAVAYGITGNAIGRQDHNGPNGPSHTPEDGPMFTLTGTDIHAVAYTLRMREGKPGGGKGPLISEEKSLTLGASTNDQTVFQPNHTTAFQPGTMTRLGGGVWEEVAPTLRAEAKRGDNEPHIAIQYDGYNQKINDTDIAQTLRLGRDSSDFVAQPVEPVMLNMQGSKGNSATTEDGISYSLNAMHGHDVHAITVPTIQYDESVDAAGFKAGQGAQSRSIGYQEGMSQTLTSDMNGLEPTVLTPTMAVRRLTPVECERLMGWPDGWTEGQADTHRYKQCGNGVASPVATWIGQQLINL